MKLRTFYFRATLLILLLLSFFLRGYAQNGGSVTGKIVDEYKQPVPYAKLTFSGTLLSTVTDEKGYFLLKLSGGSYTVSVKALGFDLTTTTINVRPERQTKLNLQLVHAAKLIQEVAVTGVRVKTATATRTLMELQDIPQAISIVGQKDIRQQAAFDLTTITRNISGLNFTGNYSGGGSAEFFNARGFDLNETQNYRWNGMMVWNWGNMYADNIEQVEFLKGPTSILYGDVAPGGVLNMVTKKPLAEFAVEVSFKTGSWGLARPSLDITGPLTSSANLRYRLNTSFEYQGSFRDFVVSRKLFAAPALAWDITPKLSINAEATFNHSSNTDDAGLVSPDGSIAGLHRLSPSLYLGEPSRRYLYSNQNYMVTANYQINKSWRLKLAGFYANSTNRPFGIWFDQPDSAGNFGRNAYGFYQIAHNGTATVEVNGTFYTGGAKHHLLAGFEYQSTRHRYTNLGELSRLDTSNINRPVINHITPDPPSSPLQPLVSIIERRGLFLQDQVEMLKEHLQLLLGIRMGSTRQGEHYFQDQLGGNAYAGYTDNIISKMIYTPRVGIVYKLREQTSVYVSWAKGYEINSPDVFAQNFRDYMTPPATISEQVEFGAKTSLLQNRLGLTLSLFEINKHNPYGFVYLNPDHPDYDLYNVYYEGHHRSRGIELEANGYLTKELSLTAAAAYTITRVINDPGYPTGNSLPNASKYTANAWFNYSPQNIFKGWFIGAGAFYKDKFFSTIANNPILQVPANYTLDAATGYHYKSIGVQLNVRNITNRVSYLNPWQFNLFDVQPLRQFILTLTYRFGKAR
ncbi:TonB-dependent siderophore receptor [Mucilaginibacter ximonensis]|uniref:TonB-dependent siderophore receptor n=1 Tax=Mucilaginibacter ximonensis TaxID=538021 RepID=A0ABW5Y9B9_9SPHI